MQSENIYNKDGTQKSCPHGATLSFPVGTVRHVKVDDAECWQCPCYGGCDYSKDKKEYRRQSYATILNSHLTMVLTIIKHRYTFEILPSISVTWLKGYILTLSWGTYTIDIQIK